MSHLYKGLCVAVVCVALGGAGKARAMAPEDRNLWEYAGGSFVMSSGGDWVESNNDGSVFFEEVKRTADFVALYSKGRDVTVLLYSNACYVRHPGSGGRFELFYRGSWQ